MTMWLPDLSDLPGPRYTAIAEAVRRDIGRGLLRAGDKLPTHRDLAWRLGVTTGTVTRAYREAERLGLLVGEVGRGTYVRAGPTPSSLLQPMAVADTASPGLADRVVDLSRNEPASCPAAAEALSATMAALSSESMLGELLTYQPTGGMLRHRQAAANWITHMGAPASPETTLITGGSQHGLTIALMAFCRAGDVVLTEDLTYPGFRGLAALLGLRLQGVAMDEHGLRPDALDAACKTANARLLYLMPSLQNPTTASMPEHRRREIAAVAARHDLLLLEDDVYGLLAADGTPPIAAIAPERTCYLTGMKVLGPGLRIGLLRVPPDRLQAVQSALRATMWMAPPLVGEIAARWMTDGTALALSDWHRREAAARAGLLSETFGDACRIGGYHAWLRLPEPWRAADITAQAGEAGVVVLPAETFAAGKAQPPQAIRLCIGCPPDRASLSAGLARLASLLDGKPHLDFASG
ncbi:PLP-dependent aminotransferase family protein [Iodidimonas sp. SYSU 1G8]|uniref:aminotransferase-like domain-containing protein n=1 Tax=Iodidimonas sp. SYSU 1G8 TaxID=3133967 RepID=UPI0031FEFE99